MDIAEKCKVRKFICLGSQAEYGFFSSPVDEQTEPIPTTAYGAVKIACCQLLRTFCEQQKIEWYWLRLFSFFGEGEGDNWLIPSIMKKMIKNEQVDLTEGLQRYAFLYAGDLHVVINKIMKCEGNEGIYNISSDKAITLRNLIERIKESLGSTSKLNFGAIPYRVNQPMLIQGDSRKFINEIGSFDITPFEEALGRTIVYYQHKFKSDTR
jgi:nucleoside-diphosphate-sugar epimerase